MEAVDTQNCKGCGMTDGAPHQSCRNLSEANSSKIGLLIVFCFLFVNQIAHTKKSLKVNCNFYFSTGLNIIQSQNLFLPAARDCARHDEDTLGARMWFLALQSSRSTAGFLTLNPQPPNNLCAMQKTWETHIQMVQKPDEIFNTKTFVHTTKY